MQLQRFSLIAFLSLLFLSTSCDKACPDHSAEAAILADYTGLDGCSWVIKLENNEVLEPNNLAETGIELKEGKKVWVKYTTEEGMASICMVGPIVTIEEIWDR
jgi:hypothetical protein